MAVRIYPAATIASFLRILFTRQIGRIAPASAAVFYGSAKSVHHLGNELIFATCKLQASISEVGTEACASMICQSNVVHGPSGIVGTHQTDHATQTRVGNFFLSSKSFTVRNSIIPQMQLRLTRSETVSGNRGSPRIDDRICRQSTKQPRCQPSRATSSAGPARPAGSAPSTGVS